ncbi:MULTISPECIES: PPOX class F420-dependent oxidoreductase [unclassified Parafrankia]|uniref:PPOX class F420-dependent oxidoreductase n=1 Tax=unclassified Parafrankia TaxID=2994368 RepID=UPI000DA4DCC3|nr:MULTISPECIES: PPOX class F420-dependent oxidoreductase [unclassified Parafrankia]TCJ36849.1 PPOX class F420-dependent oxidoreductase [Parafrankia sp. BMG5.11]SQD96259.1 Pyridoxamine 5'-phosphate oxidase-related FMN-binding [Parafrankia sp. Ea1.12]
MDLAAARAFVLEHHRAVLGTTRRDGTPQLSPVLVGVEGDTLVISTRVTALKVTNIERDPRVHLCVLPDGFFGPWVQISGTAEIIRLPDALDGLVAYYRQISGEHPDWDDYRAAMVREQRCLIRVTPTTAGPDRSG